VFEIAAAVFPAEDSGLSPKQREAVEAACAICREGGRGTARSIGERLGLSRTAVLSRLRAGERAGFLQRCDDGKPGSTNQWQPGEELPTATSWLRPPGEVSELWGQKQPAVKADEPPELVTPLVTPPELPQVKADCGREAVCAAGGDTPLVTPLVTPDKSEHPQDSCGPGGSGNGGVTSCDPKGQGAQAAVSPLILSPSPVLPVDTHAPATPDSEAGLCYWAPKSRRGPDGASTATKRRPYSKPLTAPVPPELQEAFEERAAIREHCGGQTRKDAEAGALEDLAAGRNVGAGAKPRTEEKGGLPPLGAER